MQTRERQPGYYLDQVGGRRIFLHQDGTVGEIEKAYVEVTREAPTRRPEKTRTITQVIETLAQTALFSSLTDYISIKNDLDTSPSMYSSNTYLDVEDMPDEVIERYEKWKNEDAPLSKGQLAEAAVSIVVSDQELHEATLPCPDCINLDWEKYACRSCGRARKVFAYPVVEYHAMSGIVKQPLDLARLLRERPDAITIDTIPAPSMQVMRAWRYLTLHVDRIPGSMLGEEEDWGAPRSSDKLHKNISMEIQSWAENDDPRFNPPSEVQRKGVQTPSEYLTAFQAFIAQHVVREYVREASNEADDFQELMSSIRQLGGQAYGLTAGVKYEGMGESGYVISLAHDPFDGRERQLTYSSANASEAIREARIAVGRILASKE